MTLTGMNSVTLSHSIYHRVIFTHFSLDSPHLLLSVWFTVYLCLGIGCSLLLMEALLVYIALCFLLAFFPCIQLCISEITASCKNAGKLFTFANKV